MSQVGPPRPSTTLPFQVSEPVLARIGNGPESPREFARGRFPRADKTADAIVAAPNSGNHQVSDHQRRGRRPVVLRGFRHEDVPHQRAGEPVQAEQMCVIRGEKHAVPQQRHAPVRADGGIVRDRSSGRARADITPDLAARPRVQREDLVRARHIHHPARDHGRRLQGLILNRVNPPKLQVAGRRP